MQRRACVSARKKNKQVHPQGALFPGNPVDAHPILKIFVNACKAARPYASHPSGAAVANRYRIPVHNDRHLALSIGDFEHFLKFFPVAFDVDIAVILVSFTSFSRIGSTRFSVNNDTI